MNLIGIFGRNRRAPYLLYIFVACGGQLYRDFYKILLKVDLATAKCVQFKFDATIGLFWFAYAKPAAKVLRWHPPKCFTMKMGKW